MKTYNDSEFGTIEVTKTIEVREIYPETGEVIGKSVDDICLLPNGEFLIFRTKYFDAAPETHYQSRHFVLTEWIKKIYSGDLSMHARAIMSGDEQEGNIYTSYSINESGDYSITTMEIHFTYDKPYENRWFVKREWVDELYKLIK